MQNQLHILEYNLKAMKEINPMSLDIEDRVEYFQALSELIRSQMSMAIKSGEYRTSVDLQYRLVDIEKQVSWLVSLIAKHEQVPLQDNKYLRYARGEFDYPLFLELKAGLQNIFFGTGVNISWVGTAFILTPTILSLNLDKEMKTLETLCEGKGLKVIKDKKRLVKLGLNDWQIYVDCSTRKVK